MVHSVAFESTKIVVEITRQVKHCANMSAASDCACNCVTPQIVSIPGTEGDQGIAGVDGSNGLSVFTLIVTSDATFPDTATTVQVNVAENQMFVVGQTVFGADPSPGTDHGTFEVMSLTGTTVIGLRATAAPGDTALPFTLGIGGKITAAGATGALAAALPNAFTDNSTGTASDTIAAGVGIHTITIPLTSLATGLGVLAIDLLTDYILGYKFKLLSFDFVTTVVGAGAGATQTFNLEIGAVDVTNTLTVTLASTATIGAVTAGVPNPIVATHTGTNASTLSIEMAAGGTVFTSGAGYFVIKVQNMDTADAAASFAAHIDQLILALT